MTPIGPVVRTAGVGGRYFDEHSNVLHCFYMMHLTLLADQGQQRIKRESSYDKECSNVTCSSRSTTTVDEMMIMAMMNVQEMRNNK